MNQVQEISAVICTLDSMASIRECLISVRQAGVGQIIVVDAGSADGTRKVAEELADVVLTDSREGLGRARNVGIAQSTGKYVLNLGSDNVITCEALNTMLSHFDEEDVHGVGALTRVPANNYISKCMNIWWKARFQPGPSSVIGTPTLMIGDLLRSNPFSTSRRFSDDSELCERWSREFGSKFIISSAYAYEVGKANRFEIVSRANLYGISDFEIYQSGRNEGWNFRRRVKSISHPMRVDYFEVVRHSSIFEAIYSTPFLLFFTLARYLAWWRAARSC